MITLDRTYVLSWYCCIVFPDVRRNLNARNLAFEVLEKAYHMWESSLN